MACHNYHDDYGVFPPAYVADEHGQPIHSWRVLILEFLDNQVYDQYDFSESWDGPNNRKLIDEIPDFYVFPGDNPQTADETNYLAVVGAETVWPGNQSSNFEEVDNLGNTIMVVENRGSGIGWTEPRDLDFATMDFSLANDAANGISSKFDAAGIVMVDAATRSLTRNVPPETVRAMLTRTPDDDVNDSRVVDLPNGRAMERIEQDGD